MANSSYLAFVHATWVYFFQLATKTKCEYSVTKMRKRIRPWVTVYPQGIYQVFIQISPLYSQNPLKTRLTWRIVHMGPLTLLGQLIKDSGPPLLLLEFIQCLGSRRCLLKVPPQLSIFPWVCTPRVVSSISIHHLPAGGHWQVYINVGTVLHAACLISSGLSSFQLHSAKSWWLLMGQSSSELLVQVQNKPVSCKRHSWVAVTPRTRWR